MHSTDLPSQPSAGAPGAHADVAELRAVHAAELAALDRAVGEVERLTRHVPATRAVVSGSAVQAHLDLVLRLTRRHCEDDDRLLWPLVAAAAGAAVDLGPLRDDHRQLRVLAERLADAVRTTESGARDDAHGSAGLLARFQDLRAHLAEHFADEERDLGPALTAYVRPEDFAAVLRAMRRASSEAASLAAPQPAGVPVMRSTSTSGEAGPS